jgi:hypothetical protein
VLNKYGRAYSYSGFDQAFDDWCDQAGLPEQCTAHGVRKAAAALMYENGASEAELCAIFGWKIGSRMAAYYAKKYNARRAQTRTLGRLIEPSYTKFKTFVPGGHGRHGDYGPTQDEVRISGDLYTVAITPFGYAFGEAVGLDNAID